jgi:hypothetical protein
MFSPSITVPYISVATRARIIQKFPNLTIVTGDIPLIDTGEKAEFEARKIMSKHLVKYEFISEVTGVHLDGDAEMWRVDFIISGD